MITGIAHVCFTTSDLEASIRFYRDVLGLTPAFEFRRDTGELHGIYIHVGGRGFIEIFAGALDPAAQKQRYRHLCLEVDDIEATAAEIRKRGGQVGEIKMGTDHSYQAWVTDPDGNRIELHHYTPQSKQTPWLK